MFTEQKDINLCLGGGGALGFAHIGVIQALEENGIIATRVSGSSMGAIVGVFYAAGFSPAEILDIIKKHKLYKITKIVTLYSKTGIKGLSNHNTLRNLIREKIPHNSFEGLQKKLFVCASNLNTAKWEIIDSGDMLDKWVAASASIPVVFETISLNNQSYTDGGVLNNMPAQPFESDSSHTIGVDVVNYLHLPEPQVNGIRETILTSMRVVVRQNSEKGRGICSYLIEPEVIPAYREFDFEKYYEIYQIGYEAGKKYIEKEKGIKNLRF